MHQNMPAAERGRVIDHVVHAQPDRCVKRSENRASAYACHHIDGNAGSHDSPQDAKVRGAAQASGAQDDADAARVRIKRRAQFHQR